MALRARLAALFSRASADTAAAVSPPDAAPAPSNGGSLSTALPPWGGQWPVGYPGAVSAENVATICACVDVISSALASLPALVYERLPDGERREAPNHPVARVIAEPNALMTWPDLVKFFMSSTLIFGNSVMVIGRDGAGQANGLFPVPWTSCAPILLPTGDAGFSPYMPGSRLAFDIMWTLSPYPLPAPGLAAGFPQRIFADNGEAFYLRERTNNSMVGVSRLARAPLVVQQALSVQQFATFLWDNIATPNLALTHPGKLSKEASDRIAASWRDVHVGPANARKLLVVEEGMKPEAISATAEDSEVLASRKFAAEEIARLYGVPPPLVGIWDNSNFANSQQANVWFGVNTLTPWARAIESEFARSVFSDPSRFHLEIDLSQLLRGDFATRAQVAINLLRAGAITANELRAEIGYNPLPGGDVLQPQAIGGKPPGTEDGAGDALPTPGGSNGTGLNGATAGTA